VSGWRLRGFGLVHANAPPVTGIRVRGPADVVPAIDRVRGKPPTVVRQR